MTSYKDTVWLDWCVAHEVAIFCPEPIRCVCGIFYKDALPLERVRYAWDLCYKDTVPLERVRYA